MKCVFFSIWNRRLAESVDGLDSSLAQSPGELWPKKVPTNIWAFAVLLNVTPVLILRRYVLFGLVPAEMEVGVKCLEILQAEVESACKYSGAQLGELFSRHTKSL